MNPLLLHEFEQHFHASPTHLIRAPGRVNLIGEHTDYNQGFVLPMAIDRNVEIILRSRPDRRVIVRSLEFDETADLQLDDLEHKQGWSEYIRGAAWAVEKLGWRPSGWEGLLTGNIPRGAGLSSSSAVTVAAILGFAANTPEHQHILKDDAARVAILGHTAEDEWVGVHGGIMDQMVCVLSKPGHALFLDCRTLESRHIPISSEIKVFVLDTATRRGLVTSAYNERRSQCDQAARALGVPALRDADLELLEVRAGKIDDVIYRRARHVITENERVLMAVQALQANDLTGLGKLLDASHDSLQMDFEVSNDALDAMVSISRHQPGCYGARMTGAGFGGCAIALVAKGSGEEFTANVSREYQKTTGLEATVTICQAEEGASIVPLTI